MRAQARELLRGLTITLHARFHRPQLLGGGDPPGEVAVWRKSASQLLLTSEHDVRSSATRARRQQLATTARPSSSRSQRRSSPHLSLHTNKQRDANQPIYGKTRLQAKSDPIAVT